MKKIKFYSPVIVTTEEKKNLLDTLKTKHWSSFKGATEGWNVEKVLNLSSEKANKFGPLEIRYLGGKFVRKLEYLASKKFKTKYCVSANSATSCLSMAIGSLNLGPGDEVILPSMSWVSTATSILTFNAIPRFCEVKQDTFCIDPVDILKKINKNTKAIILVHLGGNSCDMEVIVKIAKKNKLRIIEDCAQAPGVTYKNKLVGTFGDVGIFSLTETKNITSGEGGLLITKNKEIAAKARLIRNHGEALANNKWSKKKLLNVIGMNYRMTEFQAAVAVPQLKSLSKKNLQRQQLFNYLIRGLKKYDKYLIPPKIEARTKYYCYMLKWLWKPKKGMISRDKLFKKLNKLGVPVSRGYNPMMHELPIFAKKIAFKNGYPWKASPKIKINYGKGTLPISEKINREFLWFKYINPPNTKKHMDYVISCFNKILKNV